MNDSWTCLMVQRGPGLISDDVRTALKVAACDLYLKKWDVNRLASDIIEGIIQTEWTSHTVGTKTGILFRAQIDCEDGSDFKINFLLSKIDLERGSEMLKQIKEDAGRDWLHGSTRLPVEELYQFYDLRGPGRALQ